MSIFISTSRLFNTVFAGTILFYFYQLNFITSYKFLKFNYRTIINNLVFQINTEFKRKYYNKRKE